MPEDFDLRKASKSLLRFSQPSSQLLQSAKQANPLGESINSQSRIGILNVASGRYLHSHIVKHKTGSKQNEVCACLDGAHDYDYWSILVQQDDAIEDKNIGIVGYDYKPSFTIN
jgi:hypothetical protein